MTKNEFIKLQSDSGLSNVDLAELLKVHVNSVSYWRSGYRTINDRMAEWIRIKIKEYLDGKN